MQGRETGTGISRGDGRKENSPAWFCSMKTNAAANRHMLAVGIRHFGSTYTTFLGNARDVRAGGAF